MRFGLSWAPDRPVDALKARWARPPSRFLDLDGMQVHLRDEGPADDPSPIVLIHGTGSSLHAWDGWADRLRGDRRVIRFDRPGFGLTGPNPTGDYSMGYYGGFVARLLDRLGVGRFVAAGVSSGGCVAWHVALACPGRVDRLILIAASGYPREAPLPIGLRASRLRVLGPLRARMLPRWLVEASVRGLFGDPSRVTPELVDRNYEITLRAGNRRALGETLRQADAGTDAAAIRRIAAPTLILWGDRDAVMPPGQARRFHADIAGSELVLFPGLGHVPNEEDPDATVAALRRFLDAPR